MTSAADLIDFLQRRARLQAPQLTPHLNRPPGEFPPGWQRWFAAMHQRAGAVTGAPAETIVDTLAARPLATPAAASAALNRWQAFNTLWRQDWHPAPREDRRWHWTAMTVSALWHVFFAAMLLWLMYLQYLLPPVREGESVVQVEYIGVGTPAEPGGGQAPPASGATPRQPTAEAGSASTAAPNAPATSSVPPPPAPALEAPSLPVDRRDVPEPVEQPVEVSAPAPQPEPDDFVLPPVQHLPQPRIAPPELAVPQRAVAVQDIPEPLQARVPVIAERSLDVRPVEARTPQVVQREVPAPLAQVPVPTLPTPRLATPDLQQRAPAVAMRELPAVQARPEPAATPGSSAPQRADGTASSTAATQAPGASTGPATTTSAAPGTATAAAQGTGPKPVSAPGSWPTPRQADDWGDAARNRPGASSGARPGLYNGDGSVRMGEPPGSASPGQPPGTITQEIANLDRAGTWLKRKPNDYEPTMFDRAWRPNETLLQEWVRKSIKQVTIPIPGTSKRIVCNVAILAFGGGCDISDPNLNDQPAVARPPPDIPFKPALQEDNGSIRPAPEPAPPVSEGGATSGG